jgi:hypothetical protein
MCDKTFTLTARPVRRTPTMLTVGGEVRSQWLKRACSIPLPMINDRLAIPWVARQSTSPDDYAFRDEDGLCWKVGQASRNQGWGCVSRFESPKLSEASLEKGETRSPVLLASLLTVSFGDGFEKMSKCAPDRWIHGQLSSSFGPFNLDTFSMFTILKDSEGTVARGQCLRFRVPPPLKSKQNSARYDRKRARALLFQRGRTKGSTGMNG